MRFWKREGIAIRLQPNQRVPLETAKQRALSAMDRKIPTVASVVADAIWPDHSMTRQGAGAAASRVLKLLEKEGLAHWDARPGAWGWVRGNARQQTRRDLPISRPT